MPKNHAGLTECQQLLLSALRDRGQVVCPRNYCYTADSSEGPHTDSSTIPMSLVVLCDGILHRLFACELYLATSPGLACVPICHDVGVGNLSTIREVRPQGVSCGSKR